MISSLAKAKQNRRIAVAQADEYLCEMQQLYQEGEVKLRPSRITYNAVMNAWASVAEPEQAERILKEMYEDYVLNGNQTATPTIVSFNSK